MQSVFADHTYLSSARILSVAFPPAQKHFSVVWRQWQAARICCAVVLSQSPAVQTGPLSGTLGPARWFQRGPTRAVPFGHFLQLSHRLLQFPVLFGEGFHPLYQVVSVLDSPSYPLKINNDNDGVRSPMSKTNTRACGRFRRVGFEAQHE